MSVKKSFDVTRKPVAASAAKPVARKTPARPKTAHPRPSLRERRYAAQSRMHWLVFLVMALVVGAIIYGLWRPEVRISEVHAEAVPDPNVASLRVKQAIQGKYFGILPRDSIFFYPEKEVRAAVLEAFPSLVAVSISRDSFTALSVEGTERAAAFYWCGESAESFSVSGASCYEADTEGLVFAQVQSATDTMASTSPLLRIYAPLEAKGTSYPVRGTVVGAEYLPNLLQFVKAVKTLGVPVLSTYIKGDEAELFVTPETRIKYVLGNEEEAARSAEAAFQNLNLLNGTIEYVDLRFEGKLYVKRYE